MYAPMDGNIKFKGQSNYSNRCQFYKHTTTLQFIFNKLLPYKIWIFTPFSLKLGIQVNKSLSDNNNRPTTNFKLQVMW